MAEFKFCKNCGRKVSLNGQFCSQCGANLGTKEGDGLKGPILGVVGSVIPTHDASGARLKNPPTLSMIFTDNKIVLMHMEPPKDQSGKAGKAALAGIATFGAPGGAAVRGVFNIYQIHTAGKAYEEFTKAIKSYDPDELLSSDARNYAIPYADIKMIEMKRPRASKTWGGKPGYLLIETQPNEKTTLPTTLRYTLAVSGTMPAYQRRIKAEDALLARLQTGVLRDKLSVRPWSKK
jgi:hypothetical protein